jgi:hypothetical protein
MTKQEYLAFHEATIKRMLEITKAKNHDYTGASEDPFANFKLVEMAGVCATEQGFLVRMSDKLSRIASFVKQGTLQVKDESVEDTLLDLANYSILMAGYIRSKKQERSTTSYPCHAHSSPEEWVDTSEEVELDDIGF